MPVTDITKDRDTRTLVITAQFAAPVERIWALYADPRQLERVWGPESHPATFERHELVPGGRTHYFMTGPEGEKYAGVWEVKTVEEPTGFSFEDFFADESYTINTELPTSHCVYRFDEVDGGTRATYTTTYATAEALQQVLDMGMEEGARSAIDQIDGFLAAA